MGDGDVAAVTGEGDVANGQPFAQLQKPGVGDNIPVGGGFPQKIKGTSKNRPAGDLLALLSGV